MISKKEAISLIQKDVESYIGEEVYIKSNAGRNKIVNKRGVIDGAYANVFLIKENNSNMKTTFSYADIIRNSLEITRVDDGQPIMAYDFDQQKKFTQL